MMTPATTTHAYLHRAATATAKPTAAAAAIGRTAVVPSINTKPTVKHAADGNSNTYSNAKPARGHARATATTVAMAKKAPTTKPTTGTTTPVAAAVAPVSAKTADQQVCQFMLDFFGKTDLTRLSSREKRLVAALQRVVKSVEDERDASLYALDEMRSELACELQRRASFASTTNTTSTPSHDSITTTSDTNHTKTSISTTSTAGVPPTSDTFASTTIATGIDTDAYEASEVPCALVMPNADAAAAVHDHGDADDNDVVDYVDDEEKCDDDTYDNDDNEIDAANDGDDDEDEVDEDAMWSAREEELDSLYPTAAQSRANVARFVDQHKELCTPHRDAVATVANVETATEDAALTTELSQPHTCFALEIEREVEFKEKSSSVTASDANADINTSSDCSNRSDSGDGDSDSHDSDEDEDEDAIVWNTVAYDDLDLETIQPPTLRQDIARMLAKANGVGVTNYDGQHRLKPHDVATLAQALAAHGCMKHNDDDEDDHHILAVSQAADLSESHRDSDVDSYMDSGVDSYSVSDVGGEDDLDWHLLDQVTLSADIGNGWEDSTEDYSFSLRYAYSDCNSDSDSDSDNYDHSDIYEGDETTTTCIWMWMRTMETA